MTRRAQENIICAGLLVFFAGVIWLCQDFGPRARMIPLPLAVFGIVLTVAQIAWQNLRSTEELRIDVIAVSARPAPADAVSAVSGDAAQAGIARVTWKQELAAGGMVALLLALIFAIGLLPAVFVFTTGYFVLTRQYAWGASLLYSALLTVSLYLMFVMGLQMQSYHGLLAPLLGFN